jgi:hypothetical protein
MGAGSASNGCFDFGLLVFCSRGSAGMALRFSKMRNDYGKK